MIEEEKKTKGHERSLNSNHKNIHERHFVSGSHHAIDKPFLAAEPTDSVCHRRKAVSVSRAQQRG